MKSENLEFGFEVHCPHAGRFEGGLADQLLRFREFGKATRVVETRSRLPGGEGVSVPTYVNEFWTARQRAACNLHEISYRACFKPQLPRFFIQRLTAPGDRVYDPFMGRGTTVLEAALLGRVPCGCDVNPLSLFLVSPRLNPPTAGQVAERLRQIDLRAREVPPADLRVFYHRETLGEICALRRHLLEQQAAGPLNPVDAWIAMVALNRLTGHSPGFFSVYTLPPNQAASVKSQRRINQRRGQTPPRRNVVALIERKTRRLLQDCTREVRSTLDRVRAGVCLLTRDSAATPELPDNHVELVVTSPPFLDVVDYAGDNWLRCWFVGIDPASVRLTVARRLDAWQAAMTQVLREVHRVLRPGGHVAFEVGEVRGAAVRLEEAVLPCGVAAGLRPLLILINDQKFTKTAHCWGVDNQRKGTNTNRVVVFQKPPAAG